MSSHAVPVLDINKTWVSRLSAPASDTYTESIALAKPNVHSSIRAVQSPAGNHRARSKPKHATNRIVLEHIDDVHEGSNSQSLNGIVASQSATDRTLKPILRQYVLILLVLRIPTLLLLPRPPFLSANLAHDMRAWVTTETLCQPTQHKQVNALGWYVPARGDVLTADGATQFRADRLDHVM